MYILWKFTLKTSDYLKSCLKWEQTCALLSKGAFIFYSLSNRYKYSVWCSKIIVNTHKKWQTRTWYINKWRKKNIHIYLCNVIIESIIVSLFHRNKIFFSFFFISLVFYFSNFPPWLPVWKCKKKSFSPLKCVAFEYLFWNFCFLYKHQLIIMRFLKNLFFTNIQIVYLIENNIERYLQFEFTHHGPAHSQIQIHSNMQLRLFSTSSNFWMWSAILIFIDIFSKKASLFFAQAKTVWNSRSSLI